ncbi:hypothetical protein RN001_010491 [Aquatica leii]|uniref:Natural resistance-associated macrophage protein n=1 Tax=Aquatica leii TaxID=1421715 RepID=A0AAN7Q3B2_9COLE|nr:hypothetical protein RN001_010491 [Aquatica leii]
MIPLSDESIPLIPNKEENNKTTSFSFKKLWMFTGPGVLMSVGFLDPGNISSDLETAALVQYQLLWVLLSATLVGLIMQRLSARLGVVTKLHLAELCFIHYRKWPRLLLWIMAEIAIISSDIQYKLGTAIAIYSLSNTLIPLWAGVLITTLDLLIFLYFDQYGLRRLELFFAVLIVIMAATFGYEFVVSQPNLLEVLKGVVLPLCRSNVMPHNLFLHSALVKSRNIDTSSASEVKEANFYFFVESVLAVVISFLINLFIVTVFGDELFGKTNHDVVRKYSNLNLEVYDNYDKFEPDLYTAGILLGCVFGVTALYIWSIGLLASAQSATMTVTYAGQYVVEGFLNLEWKAWQRALFCKILSIVPTFLFAFYLDTNYLTNISTILNTVISIQLPFAMLPTIAFTSNAGLMGQFVNCRTNVVFTTIIGMVIIGVNTFFVIQTMINLSWIVQTLALVLGTFYLVFYFYLIIHMLILSGVLKKSFLNYIFVNIEASNSYSD